MGRADHGDHPSVLGLECAALVRASKWQPVVAWFGGSGRDLGRLFLTVDHEQTRWKNQMSQELLIGAVSLVIAAGLIFIGLPDKNGVSPRFVRFEAAVVLYPPLIMVFLVGGVAQLMTAILTASH